MDPASHSKYRRVGASMLSSATDLSDLAVDGDFYGNAIALMAIHASIAYTDALCIRFGSFKSAEGDHQRAIDALQEALGDRARQAEIRLLQRVVSQKDQVAYQGDYYTVAAARIVLGDARAFARWAEELLI